MVGNKSKTFFLASCALLATICVLSVFAQSRRFPAILARPRQQPPANIVYHIKNVKEGATLSGKVKVIITTNWQGTQYGDWNLSIDGQSLYSTSPELVADTDGSYPMAMLVSTNDYPNGKHILSVSDGKRTETRTVVFLNPLSGLSYDAAFVKGPGPKFASSARIKAVLDKAAPWNIKIHDVDGRLVKVFSGNSDHINVEWDGRDNTGRPLDSSPYFGKIVARGTSASFVVNK